MFLSSVSVRRPVFTTMLVLVFVVLGVFGYIRMAVELMPNVEFPFVTITTVYPGAGPEEIESQITKRVEDAVSTISDVDLMESISRESVSFVIIRFVLEKDVDDAANDVRAKVDAILNDLPSGTDKPKIEKFEMGAFPIISLAVSSKRDVNYTYTVADNIIRDRLSQVSGVATVDITGGQRREIQVAADRHKLNYFGLPISALTQAIVQENMNVPEGRIVESDRELTIRTMGEFPAIEDIGDVRLPLPAGGFVFLRDVATVRDTYQEPRSLARFNGQSAVEVDIVKRAGANTIETADKIYKAVDDLRRQLPPDIIIDYARDESIFIRDAVADVRSSILIGIVLTSVLLFIFLRNLRITIIAAIVMPASIISTFLLMQASGFTLNILTLMALGVSVGVLVTSALVVIENIIRHLQLGETPDMAAIKGTDEVALPVLASILTNIVVFVPIAFMRGIVGRFFVQFGLTVVYSTVFSLLIAFTLIPMLSAIILRQKGSAIPREESAPTQVPQKSYFLDRWMKSMEQKYRDFLAWSLVRSRRRILVYLTTVVLFILGVVLIGISGGEFMPRVDEGNVTVTLELPSGTPLAVTEKTVREVESVLKANPECASILSTIGSSGQGVNEAVVLAKLEKLAERKKPAYEIANMLRPKLANIAGADISVTSENTEGGANADLEIEVMGNELETLKRLAEQVRGIVAQTPGLVDVETSWKEGGEELVFVPNREEIARRGLSTGMVAALLRNSFEGSDESVFRELGEEYVIRVQFDDTDRNDARTLREMRIVAGSDRIPLTQLGQIEIRRGESEILRRERQKKITVLANIGKGTLSEKVRVIDARINDLDMPPGYQIKFAGMYEMQQESFSSLFEALILAIILTYIVLAMSLESFFHSVTVMITLPLGLIGSAMGLFFGGQTINIVSLMAMIMLVGIVVNNAILLIDYITALRRHGSGLEQAIIEACPVRLRPIIMTNLAIAVGMIPQIVGKASGFEYRAAMGFVTMGGVLVSAIFTLAVIPVLYFTFERLFHRRKTDTVV